MIEVSDNISKAKQFLDAELNVAIPTETVYGLAGNGFSKKAVESIFSIKQRPLFNPLILHIGHVDQLFELAKDIPDVAIELTKKLWPGAITLILPKKSIVPDLITAGKDTVAVRMPNHPLTLELLKIIEYPLAAPSANPFGRISPTNAAHVVSYFENEIPMVLDGGDCKQGIESTIIGFENNKPIVYRLGATSLETIENIAGKVTVINKNNESPEAPGMLDKHYAPKTKFILTDTLINQLNTINNKKVGVITFGNQDIEGENLIVENLSSSGDLEEAMASVYAAMHRLDQLSLDIIIAQKMPDVGLGKSINDRLQRAAKN